MTTVSNTQWQTNPLLKTSSPSTGVNVQQAVDNQTSQFTGPIGQTMIPTGTTSPAPTPTSSVSPTTPGVPSNVPDSTIQDLFAQAGVIQTGIDNLRGQEATVGQSFASPEFQTGPTFEDIYGKPIDEDAIRRQQLQLFQGQIDATNQIYDQMLNQSRMEGQGRLGSQRAMAARGGLLGSDFGAAQKQKVQSFNTDINNAIQQERVAKIGSILGDVRSAVQTEIANKRAAKQQGAENYLNFLKGEQDRKQGNINLAATALLTQGIDPTTLDENELGAIAMEAGTTPQNIIAAYQMQLAQQSPEERQANNFGFMSTSGGIFRTDPATGEAVFIPSGGGGTRGGVSSVTTENFSGDETFQNNVPTFEEFIQAAQEQERMSFTPETREAYRKEYDRIYGGRQSNQPPLTELTSSSRQSLQQAGLSNAPGDVQTFYLNAPNDFKSFFAQGVALGNFNSNLTAAEMQLIQEAFEEEEKSSSSRSI